jgi:hypothetical protein
MTALALGLCAASAPAFAQASGDYDARVAVLEPLSITKLADLDFGNLVVTTGGTIVLTPTASATCAVTGGVVHAAECQPAVFGGVGPTGQRIRVRRPVRRTITLTGPGDDMTVTDITINGDPDLTPVSSNPNWERFRIGSADGSFLFHVGGTLNVNPNQAPGVYSGTFEIRLDYQ